ncbi:type ISP restriction/modification enzyme [Spirosoma sp.]|uniref:type ISP restriction/modification enzyme n=1 Tax=Spirosoma sp. TaxID=1899569 RepID=UPI003B3A8509
MTDYLEWVWLKNGKPQARTRLCYAEDLSNSRFKLSADREQEVTALIEGFLSQAPKGVNNAKGLAKALATRTRNLKEFLETELNSHLHDEEHGPLIGLYETFKGNVSSELTVSEFCDAFAQMLSYGLFLAKLNADTQTINLYNAKRFIPQSFDLIKELMGFLDRLENEVYQEVRWIVDEILSVLNNLDLSAIQETLSFNQKNTGDAADPYLYFYEDFLSQYDRKLRDQKGVYYTPPPIVNFIVRAVNDTLKDTFGITDGLADRNRVTVLDFATGTGTFLLEVVKQIMEHLPANSPKRKLIIQEHILKNIYGFEYLIAPYTVAHLKLSQYLKENGYEIGKENSKERLQIYLTNTLEPINTQYSAFLPALSREGKEAQKVKEKPILVIVGNPPYNYNSKNPSEKEVTELIHGKDVKRKVKTWIGNQLIPYSLVDGVKMKEKNPRANQNDYVKFIRFAQWKMEQVKEGIICIITDNSYLDNITNRGMRQSLMNTFNQIIIIDLHGNTNKREEDADGARDENVFDIIQGVAIVLFIKKPNVEKGVFIYNLFGRRKEKYEWAQKEAIKDLPLKKLQPNPPNYLFRAVDEKDSLQYDSYLSLQDIFNIINIGITTARDKLTIKFTSSEINDVVYNLSKLDIETIRDKFDLGSDTREWKISFAQEDVRRSRGSFTKILYRPFDTRYTYYTGKSSGFYQRARAEVMQHMLSDNIALLTNRFTVIDFQHAFVTANLSDNCTLSNLTKERTYSAPLYLYEEGTGLFAGMNERKVNFKKEFIIYLTQRGLTSKPETVFGYIYAILHSPKYRTKYIELLKTDFPRIPFTDDIIVFENLAELGWALVQAHLLKYIPASGLGDYMGAGNNEVNKPFYREGKLYINSAQYFDNIPADVYEFRIGCYQVLDKYLKDRKDRILSLDEIENVEKVANVLAFTIEQMKAIDDLTRDWI